MERLRVPLLDAAFAFGLLALLETLAATGTLMSGGGDFGAVLAAAALTLPLAWRRRAPLAATLVVAATIALDDVAVGWDRAVISFPASIAAAYAAGAYARQRAAALGLAALLAANTVDAAGAPGNRMGDVALGLVVFSFVPWLVGQALRRERNRSVALRELSQRLEASREERARAAAGEERARIARELHDLLGHTISVITIQADAAAKLLRHDAARAHEPLETIQASSRDALDEMRRLVGLLREDSDSTPLAPQPGVAQLAQLVDEVRATGVRVDLQVKPGPPLPPTLDLCVYRIVQECLTNVRKHAGASATARVRVQVDQHAVDIDVRDDGAGARSHGEGGHGLVGIRERVALLGGELAAGADPRGGFVVHARLPVVAPVA